MTKSNTSHGAIAETPGSEHPSDTPKSGVRFSTATLSSRIEDALTASTATATTLADLLRTTQFLTATVASVRQANAELTRELENLKELVIGDRQAATAEREQMIAERDQFIAMLMSDHERELETLRAELVGAAASLEADA